MAARVPNHAFPGVSINPIPDNKLKTLLNSKSLQTTILEFDENG